MTASAGASGPSRRCLGEVDRAGRSGHPPDRRRRPRQPGRHGRDPRPAAARSIEPVARDVAPGRRRGAARGRGGRRRRAGGHGRRGRRRRPRPTTGSSGSSPGSSSWRPRPSSRRPGCGPRPSRRSSSCSPCPACSSSSSTTCCRPTRSGPAKFVLEGSVAITVATLLVALTGGAASPFFFAFPLIVGGAALVVSPPITLALTAAAGLGYLLAVIAGSPAGTLGPTTVAIVGINLTALVLLAYVAMVIAREQRRARDAAIRLSTVDSLTGLFNRTFFFAAIDREIARSARSGRGFCLLMMDLDELKSINDRLGHFYGDRVLRGVGEVISPGRPPDRHGRPLRRRRVRRPAARDRPDRRVRAGREDPHRRRRACVLDLPGDRTAAVAVDRRRQLPRRRPDGGRADHQRRRRDVRLEAGRQEPRDRRPDAAAGATRRRRCSIAR